MSTEKTLRAGSAEKRAAILQAARELFLSDGFDRTSVDAVAHRAVVSKRTLYDYFGDKQTLLQAVVDMVGRGMQETIEEALDDTIARVTTQGELEDALVAFCLRVATDMLGSAEYATLIRLSVTDQSNYIHIDRHAISSAPEEAVAARFSALADAGLLEITDARLAADHFVALTFSVAINRLGWASVEGDQIHPFVVEGVRAFLRAYQARWPTGPLDR